MAPRTVKRRGARRVPAAERGLREQVNVELYKRNAELAVRNKTLALLRQLDEISMGTVGLADMARQVTSAIGTALGYEVVSLAILEAGKSGETVRWVATASPIVAIAAKLRAHPKGAVAPLAQVRALQGVVQKRQSVVTTVLRDVYPDILAHLLETGSSAAGPLRSSLVHPLRFGTDVLGVLILTASRDLQDLTEYERESIQGIIGLVSLAIYKASIYEELQRTAEALRFANDQLAQLDKAKTEFLSIASHQLYTPLTALKGYLSMVQEGDFGAVAEKQKPIMGILRQSSDRLIDLIRNLLDVSRIESGRLELSMESLDLVAVARDLVTELMPNAQRKKLALTFQAPSGAVPHVVADAQRLRQVLLNVLDNSIKYTERGTITVRVSRDGTHLVYAVQDTGKGIAPEELGQLFAKFTRVGGADRYHTEGTGLGLYVARQIVREHHGDIWAESPGRSNGSTFSVKLPVEGSPEALTAGTKVTVGIKAAEAGERPAGDAGSGSRGTSGRAQKNTR